MAKVARNGTIIGDFEESQFGTLLQAGTLLPSDCYWDESAHAWVSLASQAQAAEPDVPTKSTGTVLKWSAIFVLCLVLSSIGILAAKGVLSGDFIAAYRKAGDHPARIEYAKATVLVKEGAFSEAVVLLTEAADAGNPQACTLLSLLTQTTHLKDDKNVATVFADEAGSQKWLARAVELKDPEAFFIMGQKNFGNAKEAMKWLLLAEQSGSERAAFARLQIEMLRAANNHSPESRIVLNVISEPKDQAGALAGDKALSEAIKAASEYSRTNGLTDINDDATKVAVLQKASDIAFARYKLGLNEVGKNVGGPLGIAVGSNSKKDYGFLDEDLLLIATQSGAPDALFAAGRQLAVAGGWLDKAVKEHGPQANKESSAADKNIQVGESLLSSLKRDWERNLERLKQKTSELSVRQQEKEAADASMEKLSQELSAAQAAMAKSQNEIKTRVYKSAQDDADILSRNAKIHFKIRELNEIYIPKTRSKQYQAERALKFLGEDIAKLQSECQANEKAVNEVTAQLESAKKAAVAARQESTSTHEMVVSRKKAVDTATISYLMKAARSGSLEAQATLAIHCQLGTNGLPVNPKEGYLWALVLESHPDASRSEIRPIKTYLGAINNEMRQSGEASAKEFLEKASSQAPGTLNRACATAIDFPERAKKARTENQGSPGGAKFEFVGSNWSVNGNPPYRYYRITGEVKNVGQAAGMPQIEMKVRAANGNVVKSVNTLPSTTPVNLQPGETCGLDQRIYSDEPDGTLEVRFIDFAIPQLPPLPR